MSTKFQGILRNIGKACAGKSLTEAEVEKIFQEYGFFLELGYEGFGKDLLAQRGRARKRFDVALLGFGGRVRTVIEFKQANAGPLESFQSDLFDKYIRPHVAQFGVLTNGVHLILYASTNGSFVEQLRFNLSAATESDALRVENFLRKKKVQLESLPSVQEQLQFYRAHPYLISAPDSDQARVFFQVFQLLPESAFGRIVQTLKDLLPKTVHSSGFARGSYEFWQKTYARELKFDDAPESWRPFLVGKATAEIAQFSFALETAYTIISRLVLAKAADDRRFPGVRFVPRIQESLNELSTRDRLKPEHYREVVRRSFERAGETLFPSIFSQDIFDWWLECSLSEGRVFFLALGEATLVLTQFDFQDLSGDLLGAMYQRYFDPDTRKALGEFYTPPEIIEFILDNCTYRGQKGHRLLDPACGSGSFLVAALRRYLKQQGKGEAQALLRDLTEGLRIVGFDINPFAVLMSQINYAALILPHYSEAINRDPDFRIIRLPIFRTDSLRIEEREVEASKQAKDNLQINIGFAENTLKVTTYLPIKSEKSGFVKEEIEVPRYHYAREQGVVSNLGEYVAALALVFEEVRGKRQRLEALLKLRFDDRAPKVHAYLRPALEALESTVAKLKDKYDDGRFLKTIEDLVLAVSLKQDLQYDFVVGNPPYVRIQKIPEHVKEDWAGKYEWTEGNYDLYIPFLERAVRPGDGGVKGGWLGKQGRLGYIISDRLLNVDYGQKLREKLPETFRVDLLVDFRDTRVFADALNYPVVLIGERDKKGKDGAFLAARVFSSDGGLTALLTEFESLRGKVQNGGTIRASAVEAFTFARKRLSGPGWWLMPPEELAVFDKLMAAQGKPLIDLTRTASGGFAGYQTSADKILVFEEIEDRGDFLKVRPSHSGERCGCGDEPIEIEKEALRPFLFGKDVGRWAIDWKRTWVMFPYDQYEMKRTLHGEVVREWNLIPSRKNITEFQFVEPEKTKKIEDRFTKAWKYLRRHENVLREREHNRFDQFDQKKSEGHLWYGATYPRGLDYYFRPKLVLQLLSRRNSVVFDPEGTYVFQAGGKGGGVYGIVPNDEVPNLEALLAFLNSRVADFLIKETSSVYGGRFYSYADQFLKGLPIAEQIITRKSKPAAELSRLAGSLASISETRAKVIRKLAAFPESFEAELHEYELDTVESLCAARPRSAMLGVDKNAISVGQGLYGFRVQYGSQQEFEFEHKEHAECLAEALRSRGRATLPLKEVLNWRLPVKPDGCSKLLVLLGRARQDLRNFNAQILSEEESLNDLVYDLYNVMGDERKIIEGFLDRFSSQGNR